MYFTLLTHAREIVKGTNTGRLVCDTLAQSRQLVWQRKAPDDALLEAIAEGDIALAWPVSESESTADIRRVSQASHVVILDGTWQEARKMYNHSPYLHDLPRISLQQPVPSRYHLRRNQLENGLCTAECVEALLRQQGDSRDAHRLATVLDSFLGLSS